MKEHFVIDPLISKRQQLLLATQLCRMVLKVCIISPYCIVASRTLRDVPLAIPSIYVTTLPLLHPLAFLSSRHDGEAGKRSTGCTRAGLRYSRYSTLHAASVPRCNTDTSFVTRPRPCMPSPTPCSFPHAITSGTNYLDRSTMLSLLETTRTTFKRLCRSEEADDRHASCRSVATI
jgi:hypothetical protein